MKIGIFGGSFNPIHFGHLIIAEQVREICHLDKILFIPVGIPSHRVNDLADSQKRYEMIKLAIKDNSNFEISDIEIKKMETSYTYDTLIKLKTENPENTYFEIIGEDSAEYLEKWKEIDKLLKITQFLVFKRNGNYKIKHKNIKVLETPLIQISATQIRNKIKKRESIRYLVNERVIKYINENKLYLGEN
ncbi:MAG: hypothetical protein B6I28_04325 [Fusobacteriia bacterium 4572_132]|nr:MAG: hypothetical protein B6I28_04325 [Fusobacteriia bacterium 4572_132]